MAKRMKLPREGLVEPEERARLIDSEDVEGHRLPTTPPPTGLKPRGARPSGLSRRGPDHGGEVARRLDDDDDVEGHRRP